MHRQNESISANRFACGSGLHSLRKTNTMSSARIFPSAAQRFAAIGMGANGCRYIIPGMQQRRHEEAVPKNHD